MLARGHADEIVYDVNEQTVRLSKDAWLTDGQGELKGPLLVYNIRAQTVKAESTPTDQERIKITIDPRALPGKDPSKHARYFSAGEPGTELDHASAPRIEE